MHVQFLPLMRCDAGDGTTPSKQMPPEAGPCICLSHSACAERHLVPLLPLVKVLGCQQLEDVVPHLVIAHEQPLGSCITPSQLYTASKSTVTVLMTKVADFACDGDQVGASNARCYRGLQMHAQPQQAC